MISPQRRTTRKEYLDASVVPVEAALTERADVLDQVDADPDLQLSVAYIAQEFRALAEELHWH